MIGAAHVAQVAGESGFRPEVKVTPGLDPLLSWSVGEQRFLDCLPDDGEINAGALHGDPEVQARIRRQPMLVWKARHVREHKRKGRALPGSATGGPAER